MGGSMRETSAAVCQTQGCFWTASGPQSDKARDWHLDESPDHAVVLVDGTYSVEDPELTHIGPQEGSVTATERNGQIEILMVADGINHTAYFTYTQGKEFLAELQAALGQAQDTLLGE